MKLGFVFESRWLDTKDGYYVKIRELYYGLKRQHQLTVTDCPFPEANIGYKKRSDFFTFSKNIDALLIVVSNMYTDKFTLSNLFGKKKIPIIWILEAPVEELSLLPWSKHRSIYLNKLRLKLLARHVDLCLCVSKEIEKYAINDLGIKNTGVLANASNPKHFKKITKPKNVIARMKNSFIVMWAGAGQYPWQALDIIIAVAKKLSRHKDIIFVMITTQTWYQIPKNLNNILTLKSVDYEDMPKYLNAANVLLCLYKQNFRNNLYNSPMKLFDYMAVEKPIIASAIGQIKEIIADGRNGLLTDNSVNDLCKKILLLKNNPRLASKLAHHARQDVIRQHNWEKVAQQITNHLTALRK